MEPEPHLQTVLFAKVTLALMLGKSAAAYLDKQRAAHMRRMQWIDLTTARLKELAEAVSNR